MKIFTAAQTRAWDAYTIAHEPVSSLELMERAAAACTRWLLEHFGGETPVNIFCGKGNNGGDGLAIARQLIDYGREVAVWILDDGRAGSPDFLANLSRLQAVTDRIELLDTAACPELPERALVVDALFGTGMNKPLFGAAASLVDHLNAGRYTVVSIDLPSGLFADHSSAGNTVVRATFTLTFEAPKLAQLLQENGGYVGELVVLPIGLSKAFSTQNEARHSYADEAAVKAIFRPRDAFAHKGSFGHSLLVAGSYGKMGAAVMAAAACLRGGTGLLSCRVPRCGVDILQTAVPEAMVLPDEGAAELTDLPEELERYKAIGIGPGIGKGSTVAGMLRQLITAVRTPLVADADALNLLAKEPDLLKLLPKGSILTPHPKEFDRLFGEHDSDFARISTASTEAKRLGVVVLLKGHHTYIALPDGTGWFNSTGNAGMAKGGSGDVLTGLLTALLAQGYAAANAAVLGVWLHGKAGDVAAAEQGMESMLPSDLVMQLGAAFRCLYP